MSKIEKITDAISEIRTTLEAECANVSELPILVRGIVNNMCGSGYTTSFAFSIDSNPKTPTATILDINSGLVLELDEGWSQTSFQDTKEVSDAAQIWLSFAVFGPLGYIVSEWSEPINIKGKDGRQGVDGAVGPQGPIGPQGPQGIQGPAGKDAVGIASTEVSYGINDSWVIEPSSWTPQIPYPDPGKYMWTKTTWTYTDGSSNIGKQVTYISRDGINGSVYEYVYFRGITADDRPPKPTGGNNTDDFKPTYTKTVYVNGNSYVLEWTDKAQGVDEVYKFEWQSERKKETTSTWGNFTEPILWAKYGEKGKDGDGVQYIFTTTDKQSAPDNPTPDNWETDPGYQNNEAEEYMPEDWSDDPIEVDEINKYCWTSIRKYRNGKWGRYSDPTLWTKWVDSSGSVAADVVVIDMDPDWVMINEDENYAETTITAFRGDDPVLIQEVTCDTGNYKSEITTSDNGKTWKVKFSDITDSESIKLHIKLSETSTRTKTFNIYHTKNDKETVSVDFGDDNILVPCSDGNTPDEGFFNNLEVPVMMRVAGQLVTVTSITPDKNPESFEMTSAGNIKVKSFPGSAQKTSVKFTVSDGTNTAEGYVNFTKFNTAGGTIAMYTLNVNANDIVCDTRNDTNEYKVYSGKQGVSDNKIKVLVNKYSSKEGNSVIEVSALPSNYAVYYANDPEDWSEDASSTLGEYLSITNNGIEIGKDVSPDKCVSFQLREWIGEGTPWSDMSEDNYKVWDSESILVDIIRDIASYQFVVTPNKIHRNVAGEIIVPQNKQITVGLSKNKAGDGETKYEALSVIPAGYDIYYEIDNNGDPIPFGGESENVTLPYTIDVSDVTNSIVLTLVVNENSEDDGQVVLSETIEITSDVPGESAYVGYLTDSLGVVSCDANGNPTAGQEFETTFKVTNGEVTSIDSISGIGFTAEISGDTIVFKDFTRDLPETTKLTISATYLAKNGVEGKEESTYTIVKLKVADASTILDFANDNIIIPCDENNSPLVDSVSTFVAMMHGSTKLFLSTTDTNVELGSITEEGYYPISLALDRVKFDDNGVCNYNIPFTGTDSDDNTYDRTGQLILTKLKVKAGESGEIWDLVLNADTPKWNNDSDKFDDDYIEGWVNIWGADKWDVASYNTLTGAERYIVCKTNEETTTYVPLTSDDFVDNGHFKIYINPQNKPENAIYLDIDKSDGAKIALAKMENGQYIPIQEEIIRASFDGRDFSKFELILSDGAIYQTYKDGKQTTVTPNEIKVLGVFEHSGPNRTKYEGELHAQHIAGLDIYYAIDAEPYSEFNEERMIEFPDTDSNGWANDDTLPITIGNILERLDVYLIAHYNAPGDNSEETVYQIVDHKELLVVPIDLPGDVEIAHLELSQDEVKVPIDEKGNVDPDFKVSITPYVYVNDDLNDDLVEYVFGGETQPTTGWTNNKSEFTASDFDNNYSYIWFRCESRKLYKKCKITKELNPIEIFIDRTVVKRDLSTNKVNDTVTIEIKKWNYNSNVWEAATGYDVTMKYTTVEDSNEKSVIINNSDNKYVAQLNTYYGINYIKFVISKDGVEKGFEEVGVITDGMDGSSREVIYYKSSTEGAPKNPTPEITSGVYQNDDTTPLDWFNAGAYQNMTEEEAAKWVDEYPGVNDTDCKYIYVSERKRTRGANSEWGSFSQPHLYAKNVVDGTPGEHAWSWRLSDPIEMISYNSDGTPNGSINASTTVLANCGGHIADVQITEVSADYGSYNGDTFTLNILPPDGSDFTIIIKAQGTWDKYTDEAELRYTVKKWFGEPATVQVHLSNDSSPVTTDSNGNYPNDVIRTVELTASSGKTNVAITNITTSNTTIGLNWTASELEITIPTNATGWSNDDVLTVPLVCTLADGYDPQTVIMSFYKVRAAKDAEYPDVYDLLVYPTSILVGVNQETGEATYETTTVTPTIIKYTATNETKVLTVSEFNALKVGGIEYSFDGSNNIHTLSGDTFTVDGKDDADEYVDVVMKITGGKTQTERILISHDPIPNIDWELELNCPERILYKSNKTTQITNVENVSCRLYKTVGGVKNYVNDPPIGFDIEWYLDGVKQTSPYTIDDVITLDKFTNSCEFVLVNQGEEDNSNDVIWDRKLVTKEYAEAGAQGPAGISPIIYPAGIWNADTAYEGTSKKAPYVLYEDIYYIAYSTPPQGDVPTDWLIEDPDWSNMTTQGWIKMDTFEAIYADIGVLKEALVGPLVFHGDYVFSQEGKVGSYIYEDAPYNIMVSFDGNEVSTGASCNYTEIINGSLSVEDIDADLDDLNSRSLSEHIANGSWIPNICFNAVTGAGHLASGNITWSKDGTVEFGFETGGEVSEDYVRDIVSTTTIQGGNIATGTIKAAQLDVDDITVKRLNTKEGDSDESGTIKIEENTISIYEANSEEKRVLLVSGGEMTDMGTIPESKWFNFDESFQGLVNDTIDPLGEVNLSEWNTWNVTSQWANPTLTMFYEYDDSSGSEGSMEDAVYDIYMDVCIVKNGTSVLPAKNKVYTKRFPAWTIGGGEETISLSIPLVSNSGTWMAGLTGADIYTVYFRFWYESENPVFHITFQSLDFDSAQIKFTPVFNFEAMEIASNGIRLAQAEEKYFVTNGSSFVMRNGQNAFGLNDGGFWMTVYGTKWFNPSIDSNGTLTFKNSTNATNADYKIS